jgi:nucleotide-binding universal stress UspA family protein
VGAHGQRKGSARVLGSSAELVLRTSSIPVLLARGLSAEPPRRVLVGVEESDITASLVEWTRVICTHFRASAMLLHVADPDLADAISIAGSRAEVRRARDHLRRASLEWLSEHAGVLRSAGIEVNIDVTFGDPASKLLVRSKPPRNDLMIIGRCGAGHVQRTIIGSVADRVLRLGKGPVFVVPEPHAG